MNADHYARAKRIFLAACRMDRGERTRFVTAECGEDDDLHEQVRRLLSVDADDNFLQTPPVAAETPGLHAGAQVGRFRIVRPLGEGGMGMVYEAEQDEPHRRVALKVIRSGLISRNLRARFRHEVRILGRLRHPGIAQIYEAGSVATGSDTLPFFAMELVEGRPLLDCAREHSLGVRERLELVAQVCDAVHHAHVKGVVHRDLKPGNILVEEAPSTTGASPARPTLQVKILDFGVARAAAPDGQPVTIQTDVGQIIGTLAYMSPEQAAGDPTGVDARSDVYSIGVIGYELLSGRLPCPVHGRPLPEAARLIREAEPTRLGSLARSLRGDVETIIGKALEKDPARRYQSAAELAADVRRFLRDEAIVARPASALYQVRRFARRNKPLVVAAAVVFGAMGTATVVSTWQARVAQRARVFAEGEQKRADLAAGAARREANRATFAGAAAAIASGDPITASRLLDGTDERSRGWAWRYWHSRLDESVAMARVGGEQIAATWLSPDGREAAALSVDGVVYRGSPWSGELPRATRLAEPPLRFATFVNDGTRIITDGPDRRVLTLFDAADGRLLHRHPDSVEAAIGLIAASADGRVVLTGPRRPGRAPADVIWLLRGVESGGWSEHRVSIETGTPCAAMTSDGRWLALGKGNIGVMIWDTLEPQPRDLVRLARGTQAIAISDDGTRIATGGVDKTIGLWDRATGELAHTLAGHSGAVTALQFDPSGRTLASAGNDLTIRLWDTAGGGQVTTLIGLTAPADGLRFSPDGAFLLSDSRDRTIRLWHLEPFEGPCVLRGHTSYVYAVALAPDGKRIFSGAWDRTLRAWDAASGRAIAEVDAGRGYVTALAVSPDGGTIATGHKSAAMVHFTVLLWDAESMSPRGELADEQGEVSELLFSADGTRLYASWDARGVDEFDLSTTPPTRRRLIVEGSPRSVALSPDGREIACGHTDGSISMVRVATGELVRRLEGHTPRAWVRGLAFHPARPLLASACDDGTARLWDLSTGAAVELRGHADKVYCVAFSPDGRTLATGSEDTTIALWDVDDDGGAEELTRLRGHEVYVYSLAFSPDGTRLVSGSGDHTVRVWDTRPVHERWRARHRPR